MRKERVIIQYILCWCFANKLLLIFPLFLLMKVFGVGGGGGGGGGNLT